MKLRDTDFVFLSARIRAVEHKLPSKEQLIRAASYENPDDMYKFFGELGFKDANSAESLEDAIDARRERLFAEILKCAPAEDIVSFFRIRFDYHNAKVLIKSRISGASCESIFVRSGRFPVSSLADFINGTQNGCEFTAAFADAVSAAKELALNGGSAREIDILLDSACFTELFAAAKAAESEFLAGYARLMADGVNLKAAVRLKRIMPDTENIERYLLSGGNFTASQVSKAFAENGFTQLYKGTALEQAANKAFDVLEKRGSFADFDHCVEAALAKYLRTAKHMAFGKAVIIGFIARNELAYKAVRIAAAAQGVPNSAIWLSERLRDWYE